MGTLVVPGGGVLMVDGQTLLTSDSRIHEGRNQKDPRRGLMGVELVQLFWNLGKHV